LTVANAAVHGADVSVRARLNRSISVIGDPVQLDIKIMGGRRIGSPPDVSVDGLEIRFFTTGEESVVRLNNGAFTSERNTTLAYQVVPQRNGTFTIPSIAVEVDGKTYNTQPVALTVQPSSATDGQPEKVGFAELVVPKKTLYLGEAIPVEFRLYVDSKVRWQPQAMPEIEGEGFTKQKMPEPHNEQVERNGRDYDMLTFKTAIAPIRAGKLAIGPGEIAFNARVPRAQRSGRNPFDAFGDIFNDPFFSATQSLKAQAPPVELTVKPLPQTGKPTDFSGAVGTFQMSVEGGPKQVKIGDPVTIKLKISGKGNFDRVTAPVLNDSTGWRAYPPSSTFQADDPVNFTGTKTFEMAVIPEAKKTAMPEFHFSYFDASAEKYVTLKSEPAPLVVASDALPQPKPVATDADNASPEPKKPAAEPRPDDILGPRYDRDTPQSFVPLYERPEFWFVQGGIGVILLGLVGFKLRRKPDAAVRQRAALRQEKEAVWRRLRTGDLGYVDFFDAAARLAQIQTALVTGRAVAGIDASAVRAAASLDENAAATIEEIFSARAELHYAGGGSGDGQVSAAERERVLGVLKQLEKGHAKG
jgi:hypothetical protein